MKPTFIDDLRTAWETAAWRARSARRDILAGVQGHTVADVLLLEAAELTAWWSYVQALRDIPDSGDGTPLGVEPR